MAGQSPVISLLMPLRNTIIKLCTTNLEISVLFRTFAHIMKLSHHAALPADARYVYGHRMGRAEVPGD